MKLESHRMSHGLLASGLIYCLLCVGCQRSAAPKLPVHPVSGKITASGKGIARAQLKFQPTGSLTDPGGRTISPAAESGDDGSFKATTYAAGDGLPAGEYAVTVTWPIITLDQGEEIVGADRFNGKYANPKNPVKQITVREGPNDLGTIELTP